MDRYKNVARSIRANLDDMMQVCDAISDRMKCQSCPLFLNCLKEETVETIWSEVSERRIADFYDYGNDLDNADLSVEDWIYEKADLSRQDDE